ncbi:MAG: cysteine desulfurase [Bacilli bacterium]|nr:cysteine desulfurase [Bacilli bacterium]MBR2997480.1 cysteine desulfurase [Bacilli bacterium]
MIYLDYAANSPVDKEVLDVFNEATIKYFANPNSFHRLGVEAKEAIDNASKNIAKYLGVNKDEIIYTSGASESNNLVIQGLCERYKSRGKHIIISKLEHNSIVAPAQRMQGLGFEVDMVGFTKEGLVDIEELKSLIRDDTILVSITSVDSELGIRQPIEEIGKLLKKYDNLYFHTDASQVIGKDHIDFSDVDLVTIAPHKFYGINGIGLLIKKENVSLKPIIYGGKSTTIYRSGTPVTASIIALDKALELATKNLDSRIKYIKELNNYVRDYLSKNKDIVINSSINSIPNTINFSIRGVVAKDFVLALSDKDVFVSSKTSCCPDNSPSKSVYALTNDKSLANSSIRVSLSHLTTKEELDEFFKIFNETYLEFKDGKK